MSGATKQGGSTRKSYERKKAAKSAIEENSRSMNSRMANFSLQCFMESIGEMSSREMWKLELFQDSVLDTAHKAEFDTIAFVQAVCILFDSIRFPPAFVGWPTPTPVHPCGPFAHTSLLFPPPTPPIPFPDVALSDKKQMDKNPGLSFKCVKSDPHS